jgi:regulator of RNase E activity RraA
VRINAADLVVTDHDGVVVIPAVHGNEVLSLSTA